MNNTPEPLTIYQHEKTGQKAVLVKFREESWQLLSDRGATICSYTHPLHIENGWGWHPVPPQVHATEEVWAVLEAEARLRDQFAKWSPTDQSMDLHYNAVTIGLLALGFGPNGKRPERRDIELTAEQRAALGAIAEEMGERDFKTRQEALDWGCDLTLRLLEAFHVELPDHLKKPEQPEPAVRQVWRDADGDDFCIAHGMAYRIYLETGVVSEYDTLAEVVANCTYVAESLTAYFASRQEVA